MFTTELYVAGRENARDNNEGHVPFYVHPSIFNHGGDGGDFAKEHPVWYANHCQQLLSETFACLVTFDRDIARNPSVKSLTFLIVSPFEFFPVVQVEYNDGRLVYYCHGGSTGWERLTGTEEFHGYGQPKATVAELVQGVLGADPEDESRPPVQTGDQPGPCYGA